MEDINVFYHSILNLRNIGDDNIIKKIVIDSKNKLLEQVEDISGFCKYIASEIEDELKSIGIKTHYIDLNNLVDVDHVILIAEYKSNNELKRFLIDPTFEQFNSKDDATLLFLSEWPSEKITDKEIVNDLITHGITEINNDKFNSYINGFSDNIVKVDLDRYLLERQIDKIFSKTRK